MDVWQELDLERAQAPEDWSGAVDIDIEDFTEFDNNVSHGWENPLDYIDRLD